MTPTDTARGPARFRAPEELHEPRSAGRAILAGLALLLLVLGVPLGLWLWTGPPPVPTGFPDAADLQDPVGPETVLVVLRAVVWLAWLQFVVSVVVEAASALRGPGLPWHVPLGGLSQRLARTLVSALLVGGVVMGGSSSASAATPPTAEPVAGTDVSAAAVQAARAETGDAPEAAAPTRDRTDGADAVAADSGGPQAADRVRASHAGVPATMTDVIGKKVYVVQPPKGHYHDNLWDIAERHLGDGRRWREIFTLNDKRQQPDGRQLVVGKLIQPGWVLVMPDDAVGLERVREAPAPPPPAPAPEMPEAPQGEGGAADLGDSASSDVTGPAVVDLGPRSGLAADLLVGGMVGAGILGALAAHRRRRRGLPAEEHAVDAEVALRAGADPARAERLDRALRGLSGTCRVHQASLPPVYAAVVGEEQVDLLLAPARPEAPAPWTPVDDGRVWRLHADVDEPAELGHAPFPGLVCLGRDAEGHDVMVDLEAVGGAVSVSGDDRIAHEVVSAIAVQLATNPWADEQRVVGHHLAPVLADVAGERLSLADEVAPVLDDLEQTRPARPANEVLTGRLARRPGVVPTYLVTGSVPTPEHAERLVDLTSDGDRGFGVVAVGSLPGTALHVDEAGVLTVPVLDLQVEAVRLSERSAAALGELFRAARSEPVAVVRDDRVAVPAPGREGDDAHWSHAGVRVGVLGPVQVRPAGTLDPTRIALATEIAVFLALQTSPVHPSVLAASIWPRGVTPEVRDATIARVREWLGTDVDGNHRLRADQDGRISLDPEVPVDWSVFCTLARRARTAASQREEAELLRRALHLVRGGFLEDRPTGRYSWLARSPLERTVPDLVTDTAHRLAELCRDDGDPAGAAAAAEAGLRIAPEAQVLWRDLVRSSFEDRGGEAAVEAAGLMADQLAALAVPVEAETEALVEELIPTGSSLSG